MKLEKTNLFEIVSKVSALKTISHFQNINKKDTNWALDTVIKLVENIEELQLQLSDYNAFILSLSLRELDSKNIVVRQALLNKNKIEEPK